MPAEDPPEITVPIEEDPFPDHARTWARSAMQTTLATTLPVWKIAVVGLALLLTLTFFDLYAALALGGAFFLGEFAVVGWAAWQARRRSARAAATNTHDSRPRRPALRSSRGAAMALDRLLDDCQDHQRWEDEGGAPNAS